MIGRFDLVRELRLAGRALARRPGWTAVAVLMLALGIGANTAVFSVVDAILLEPPPYDEPDRIVRLFTVQASERGPLALREIDDLREQLIPSVFTAVAAHGDADGGYNLSGGGPPESAPALLATHDLFEVLGVAPTIGGVWPEVYDRKRNHSILLSDALWRQRYGADPDILDRTLLLDGAEYQVYGVLPPGFEYPLRQRVYRALAFYDLDDQNRGRRMYQGIARLADGVTLAEAQRAVEALGARLATDFPVTNEGVGLVAVPLVDLYVGDTRPHLVLLGAAVVLILLLACANFVQLLLVRSAERRAELAVRASLGAGRRELARVVLFEGALLTFAGAFAGLGLAWLATDRLGLPLGADLPPWVDVAIDQRVLWVTLGVSVVVGLVTSLLPARQAARTDPARALSAGGRSGSGGRRRAARVLVIAQAALAVVLMVAAALVTQSFARLQAADLGFDTGRMLTFEVRLGWKTYQDDERAWAFWRNLQDRLRALPGVDAVSTASALPFADVDPFPIAVDGLDDASQRRLPPVQYRYVEVGALEMLGIDLLAGRTFDSGDRPDTQRVTVLSRRLAERLFPGRSALGERVKFGKPDSRWPWMEVIGVVEDVRYFGAASTPGFDLYVSPRQNAHLNAFLLIETSVDPATLADEAARAVLATDPDQASTDYRSLEDRWAASLWRHRLATRLIGLFAGLAAILATVGLYALLAWSVRERRRELALRCALGAERRTIVRMVLRDALSLAGRGVGIGLVLVLFAGRLLDALLWEIDATDLPTLVTTPLVLVALTVAAAWLPAVRAARVEVVTTLDAD